MINKCKLVIITALFYISVINGSQDRCLGLVLKGGANRGSYEAGAISTFVKVLAPEEVQYDVVSGVSVGALNAAYVSLYPKGEEQKMSDDLLATWRSMDQSNFYENWWFGILNGLLFKKGLYNSAPLIEFIRKQVSNRPIQRLLSFISVDAKDGDIIAFDETLQGEDLVKALAGSAAMPFVFPGVKFQDGKEERHLIDGGTAWNLDVQSAIRRCRELVDDDSKIVLDVIDVGFNQTLIPPVSPSSNAIQNFLRRREIKNYHKGADDLLEMKRANPDVKIRYLVIPQTPLVSEMKVLSLDKTLIEQLIQKGTEDALRTITNSNTI